VVHPPGVAAFLPGCMIYGRFSELSRTPGNSNESSAEALLVGVSTPDHEEARPSLLKIPPL